MSKFLITGGTGFLGKNMVPYLQDRGHEVKAIGTADVNLENELETLKFFCNLSDQYEYIIHGAALQGAADWPLHHKAEQYDANMRIHANVLKGWHLAQPYATLVGIGSSCSYPGTIVCLKETDYWSGPMHESVDIYGMTKKAMQVGIEAYKAQYGLKGTTVMFATLYGPHDIFDEGKSHVVSALIKKFVEAEEEGKPEVEVWGDGSQTRELIYVEDQIDALMCAKEYTGEIINIGTGVQTSISTLANIIKDAVGYKGNIFYNTKKFVGVKNKVLDTHLFQTEIGWVPNHTLKEGIQKTVNWYKENHVRVS